MIYRQNKREDNSKVYFSVIFWLALAVLVFFNGSRSFLKSLTLRTILFFAPEAVSRDESRQNLALILELKRLKEENGKLKQILGVKNQARIIPARIKLGGGYLFTDVLVLDKGLEAGVKVGDVVSAEDNILIGLVSEAGNGWSKILPAGYAGEKIILRKKPVAGSAESAVFEAFGMGGGEIKAELPASLNFKAGDPLYWGENSDLIVGFVDRVLTDNEGGIQRVFIVSPFSFIKPDYVTIISPYD